MSQKESALDAWEAERRALLKSLGLAGLAGVAVASGWMRPARADDVPGWPRAAFAQRAQEDAVKALYDKPIEPSDKITLDVPEIAENGAVVPVSISTSLSGVTSLAILIPENPFTLAAQYTIPEGTSPAVACRLKMAKTSKVVAIVESEGKLYSAAKEVKVTLGGCGG